MGNPSIRIDVPAQALAEFCRRHGLRRLALFGSVLRDDFGPQSDIDVLVEFDETGRITLFGLARLENELSDLLGRRADVHETRSLGPRIREHALRTAKDVYVAA